MHQLIRIITEGGSNDDATGAALTNFEGRNPSLMPPFDYGKSMNEDGARWADGMPDVVQETGSIEANTDDGLEIIQNAWTKTMAAYERNIGLLRNAFDQFDDHELLDDPRITVDAEEYNPLGLPDGETSEFTQSVRYAMHTLGQYKGPDIFLYDEYGMGIRTPSRYEELLDNIENDRTHSDSNDVSLYVVPVDVHY